MRTCTCRIVLICAWGLAGCGGGEPLDDETARSALHDHSMEPIKATFSSSPRFDTSDPRIKSAYLQLMESHVLECSVTAELAMCVPGRAGGDLKQEGTAELSVPAGQWAVSGIVSIERTGRSSATAEVRMSFDETEQYREFERAFSDIQTPASTQALSETKQPKIMHARFERDNDGWHLQSLE